MSGGVLGLDAADAEALATAISSYGERAEDAINGIMHASAGEIAYRRINPLIHPSGRTFRGHRASARASDWPRYDTSENLAVTVRTQGQFNYLYFPDDGSTTRRHAGGQRFFERGGELATPEIVEACLGALTKEWSQ